MGFDFYRFLTPEQRERVDWLRRSYEEDVAEARAMSDSELCEKTEYYLSQCEAPYRWQRGEPVYDGVVAHIIIPELVRRIRKAEPPQPKKDRWRGDE